MSLVPRLRSLLRNLLHGNQVERDLDSEINSFVEGLTRERPGGHNPIASLRQE